MKKRGIDSSMSYIDNVLNKLEDLNQNHINKNIYSDCIVNLFKIKVKRDKNIILSFADKEFDVSKKLEEIKLRHIQIFNELFNRNKKIKTNEEINHILKSHKNIDNFKIELIKLDKEKKNYIEYYQMINLINKYQLDDIAEELLLLTKDKEIFNKMNYNCVIDLLNQKFKHDEQNIKKNLLIIKNESINITNNILTNINTYTTTINDESKNTKSIFFTDIAIKNEKIDNILKNFSLMIKNEGSNLDKYLLDLKKSIDIGKEVERKRGKSLYVIELEKFIELITSKNFEINDKEKENLFHEYGLKLEDGFIGDEKFLNYHKIYSKLVEFFNNNEV